MPALSAYVAAATEWPVLHISASFTLAFLAWAFFAPVVGACIDRGWGGAIMSGGGIAGTLTLIFLSTVTDRWVFSAALLVLGVCMAATLYDPCFALLMRRLEARAADATATVTLVAGLATLVTFPLVMLLSSDMAWNEIVLVFAGLALIAVFLLPEEHQGAVKVGALAVPPPFKLTRGPVLIAFAFGLSMMGHAILLFLLPVVLARESGSTGAGILAVAVLGPAQIAGRLVWKRHAGRFEPHQCALVLFSVFCIPPVLLWVSDTGTGLIYGALIVQGACYGVHTIMRPVLARHYLPVQQLGRGLGGIATVGILMMAFGPLLGGWIWSSMGFAGLMVGVNVLNAIALCLIIVLFSAGTVNRIP